MQTQETASSFARNATSRDTLTANVVLHLCPGIGVAASEEVDLTFQKLSYFALQLAGLGMAGYKLRNLGLIPSTASDFLEFIENEEVRSDPPPPGCAPGNRFVFEAALRDDDKTYVKTLSEGRENPNRGDKLILTIPSAGKHRH